MLLDLLKAIIFGIVEGVCEWLPISSTGHLILLEELIRLDISSSSLMNEQFRATFDVVIQLGAILAVIVIYFENLNPLKKKNASLWKNLIIATLPTAIIGFGADALCERFLGKDLDALLFTPTVVASTLIIYGLIFIVIELIQKSSDEHNSKISALSSLFIGFFQALALIPGTSRSGATILGARCLGLDKKSATEFSFFLAVPAILGASAIKLVDFATFTAKNGASLTANAYLLLAAAFVTAFLVSMPILKFFIEFLRGHSLIPFGIYRIALGIIVLFTL